MIRLLAKLFPVMVTVLLAASCEKSGGGDGTVDDGAGGGGAPVNDFTFIVEETQIASPSEETSISINRTTITILNDTLSSEDAGSSLMVRNLPNPFGSEIEMYFDGIEGIFTDPSGASFSTGDLAKDLVLSHLPSQENVAALTDAQKNKIYVLLDGGPEDTKLAIKIENIQAETLFTVGIPKEMFEENTLATAYIIVGDPPSEYTPTPNGGSGSGGGGGNDDPDPDPFLATTTTAPNLESGTESIIVLEYTPESTNADACSVSSLSNLTESTPCVCDATNCRVGVTSIPTYFGPASFNYTINAGAQVSASSTVNVTVNAPIIYELTIQMKSGNPVIINADGSSTTTFEATLLRQPGDVPVSGESIALNIPTDGGSTSSPQVTNASGVVEFEITSSLTSGYYQYYASWNGQNSNTIRIHFTECFGAVLANSPFANWSGGTDPGGDILICTKQQFLRIADTNTYDSVTPTARLARDYKLGHTIDLAGETPPKIGDNGSEFTGSFDGQNYTIENFTMNLAESWVGMFGVLDGAAVSHFTITTTGVTGDNNTGVVAGRMENYATLTNVHVRGATGDGSDTLTGDQNTGGLTGVISNSGSAVAVSQCSVEDLTVTVSGDNDVGGLVGYTSRGLIEESYAGNNVSVDGAQNIGGLVGRAATAPISDSYSLATVSASSNSAGGLIGHLSNSSNVTNVYVAGDVCSGDCGGVNDGPIIGYRSGGTLSAMFFDNVTTGWATGNWGVGRTTTSLQNKWGYAINYSEHFDFASKWREPRGGGYPILMWQDPLAESLTVADLFAGGDGSSGDPWEIVTEEHFRNIVQAYSLDNTTLDDHFELLADITFTDDMNFVGSSTINFEGHFNGNGNTLSNLTLNYPTYYGPGLFGYVSNGATLRNFHLEVKAISGLYYVGGVAGRAGANVLFEDIVVSGVDGDGSNTIQSANTHAGGIVGYFGNSIVNTGMERVGVQDLTITASGDRVGGLAGYTYRVEMYDSYVGTQVSVSGNNYIGGMVGDFTTSCILQNVYTHATVNGNNLIGGIVGNSNTSAINMAYTTGNVCNGDCTSVAEGPVVGNGSVTINLVHWNEDTAGGWTASNHGRKSTTAVMQTEGAFLQNYEWHFDFGNKWRLPEGGGYPILQWQDPPASTPSTVAELFAGGDGTPGNPWQISNETQLQNMLKAYSIDNTVNDDSYIITSDITLTERLGTLGNATIEFLGNFDGDGHTISNLEIILPDVNYVSLLGRVNGSEVKDLTLLIKEIHGDYRAAGFASESRNGATFTNVHAIGVTGDGSDKITSENTHAAGIVSTVNNSVPTPTIIKSSADGLTITGTNYIGGIVGISTRGSIEEVFAGDLISLSGASYVGGIAGRVSTSAHIENSYSKASITSVSSNYAGGITGSAASSNVTNVYASGDICGGDCSVISDDPLIGSRSISTSSGMFWNTQTTGWATDQFDGKGLTTAQMQSQWNFTINVDEAFDFVNVWRMPPSAGSPILQWQDPITPPAASDLFAGGDGSMGAPWQISNQTQLRNMLLAFQVDSSTIDDYFVLTSNITLTDTIHSLGTAVNPFAGNFNGGGFTIANLSMDQPDKNYVSLFGYIEDATIEDVTITVNSITGDNYVAAVAANSRDSLIQDVHVRGVTGDGSDTILANGNYVGGLAGRAERSSTLALGINRSGVQDLTITTVGSSYIGGLVGEIFRVIVQQSRVGSQTTVTGIQSVGGFAGNITSSSTIEDCYTLADVNGTSNYIGGFTGSLTGSSTIYSSYQSGDVCGGDCLVGNDGPFLGWNSSSNVNASFWDATASGWGSSSDGYELTTAKMQSKWNFQRSFDVHFNFATVWREPSVAGPPILQWEDPITPYTLSDFFEAGDGSMGSPWQIDNAEQFRNIMLAFQLDPTIADDYFILTSNINLGSNHIHALGTVGNPFEGNFDGNNYTISNLTIDLAGTGYASLFGRTDGATLQDFNVTVNSVTGASYVGVVASSMIGASLIHDVHVSGVIGDGSNTITGTNYVGGLAAYINNAAVASDSITDSSVTSLGIDSGSGDYVGGVTGYILRGRILQTAVTGNTSVDGDAYVGGIAGYVFNTSLVDNTYSHASVTSTGNYTGGLVGFLSNATIDHSFQTGDVCGGSCPGGSDGPAIGYQASSTIGSVFWNEDTSGWSSATYGTAASDTDMTTDGNMDDIVDFLDSEGWSGTIWELDPDNFSGSYPELK